MRWRIPIVAVLALFVAVSCDQQPVEPPADGSIVTTVPTFANGATVFRGDFGCAVVDGNGHWFPPDFTYCGTEVATYSQNGNASITVQVSGVPNTTGKTVHWGPYNPGSDWAASYPELTGPPYPCYLLDTDRDYDNPLYTVKWKATVTPGGQGTLKCHYKHDLAFNCEDYGNCAPD